MLSQAVILVGGKGTRLGEATKTTPKPLMEIEKGVVFLDLLIENTVRQGFNSVILLAGHFGEQIARLYHSRRVQGAVISVVVEDGPLGTGGAIRNSAAMLDNQFLLMNGDTFFDFNLRHFAQKFSVGDGLVSLALRHVDDVGRYGSITLSGDKVVRMAEKDPSISGAGLINAGIYVCRREVLSIIPDGQVSLETQVFPRLCEIGKLDGLVGNGYFIDIGLPEALAEARTKLPAIRRRPIAFLDRDGVINVDVNYAHRVDQLEFVDGAPAAIRLLNDKGYRVVVVTNQAGVAHGYYEESDIRRFHEHIQHRLYAQGAYIDEFYYCPFHPDAKVPRYRGVHEDRKPNPGMLLKALKDFPVEADRCFLVGDKQTDLEAASRAGVPGFLFEGKNLEKLVTEILEKVPQSLGRPNEGRFADT